MSTIFYAPINNVSTFLIAPYTIGQTGIVVDNASLFGSPSPAQPTLCTVVNGSEANNQATYMIREVKGVFGKSLLLGAFIDGTVDQNIAAGAAVQRRVVARDFTDMQTAINNVSGGSTSGLAPDSGVVHIAYNETIGGTKTFTNRVIADITGNAQTVTSGVYQFGSYAWPTWITSISGNVIQSTIPSSVLPYTSVNPGAYTDANLTVDAAGRITVISSGPGTSGLMQIANNVNAAYSGMVLFTDGFGNLAQSSGIQYIEGTGLYRQVQHATDLGVLIQGKAGQSRNLIEIQNNNGFVMFSVSKAGGVGINTANAGTLLNSVDSTTTGFLDIYNVVGGSIGATAGIRLLPGSTIGRWLIFGCGSDFSNPPRRGNFEFYDINAGVPRFIIDTNGFFNVGGGFGQPWNAQFSAWSNQDVLTMQVRGYTGQTSDLEQWQSSTGSTFSAMNCSGLFSKYNSDTTAGNGIVSVVGNVALIKQTAAISPTVNIYTPVQNGTFEVSIYQSVTTSGAVGNLQTSIAWVDDCKSQQLNSTSMTMQASGNFTQDRIFIRATPSSGISYKTTFNGSAGSSYDLFINVTRLS